MAKSSKRPSRKLSSSIGYGKPPVEHRFKPGKSGNPRGRPKHLPELGDLIAKELRRSGYMMVEGKRVSVTRLELLAKQIIASAGKGSAKALNLLESKLAKIEAKQRKEAILAQGTTVHEGMTAKEAMEEYSRWFREISSQEIFDA